MLVALRADASRAIGLGHIKRCLALSKALRNRGAECKFFVRPTDVDAASLVCGTGFDVVSLDDTFAIGALDPDGQIVPHASWLGVKPQADAANFLEKAGNYRPNLVVVDHYAIDARWHERVRSAWNCPIAAIDDLADRSMAVDLIIDHNPTDDHAAKYQHVMRRPAMICGGSSYALIDSAYSDHGKLPWHDSVLSVGIFVGGTDLGDFSSWALRACRKHAGWNGPVQIATTSANPHLRALVRLSKRDTRLTLSIDAPDLADFHASHDVQIGAGGGALWERCVIGVPTIALICAQNQRLSVPRLARDGVVIGLDVVERSNIQCAKLGSVLRGLIESPQERLSLREQSLDRVDGQGTARAADALLGLLPSGTPS